MEESRLMMNAIILAAGQSKSFSPYFYDIPKGLLYVKGERLIERQIKQLREAGIDEIVIVVGYLREKFFYLQKKYGVKLISNTHFSNKGNIYSLYLAKDYIDTTIICCPDQYYDNNPFFIKDISNSFRQTQFIQGVNKEFSIDKNVNGRITNVKLGGKNRECMVGFAFFNSKFSKRFIELLDNEINDFGIDKMFWEEFYKKHIEDLDLYANLIDTGQVIEFDELQTLMDFDPNFIKNVNSNMFDNISRVLNCDKSEIEEIIPIKKGLTNISFKFRVHNKYYVYRHPGLTSNNLVNRKAEAYAENISKQLGINKTLIHIDEKEGWKISIYMENLHDLDWKNKFERKKGIECLQKLHNLKSPGIYNFDTYTQAIKLLNIAKTYRGNIFEEFKDLISLISKVNNYIEKDNFPKCVCHNDTYAVNYLINDEDIALIDWEYTGYNDPANDIACIVARDNFSRNEIDQFLEEYFGRKLSFREYRHYIAYIGLCSFYWFSWALYKDSMGDDEIFMLDGYNVAYQYGHLGIDMYENEEKYII